MAEYVLKTTDDYRAHAERVQEFGETAESEIVKNAADSILVLADRIDYLTDLVLALDTWIEVYAYNADGSKV